ncbi:MAG: GDSL-type esterase/lipase family protein [Pseudomonadota bacterium]|nr:GDSL-type esterase/lipase family protein [Pseudomonadota bacterium]
MFVRIAAAASFILILSAIYWLSRFGAFSLEDAAPGDRDWAHAVAAPALSGRCAAEPCPVEVTLFGASIFRRGDWTDALAAELTACHGAPVTIRKLALSGASSAWGRGQMEGLFDTDLVVVSFSGNDASLWRGLPLKQSRANHIAFIEAARARGIPIYLATMSPARSAKALARPGQTAYKALYRTLARDHGAGLIDDAPRWAALPDAALKAAIPDGLHPTQDALRAIAVPGFSRVLGNILCRNRGSPD